MGRGGVAVVARTAQLSRTTVQKAVAEVDAGVDAATLVPARGRDTKSLVATRWNDRVEAPRLDCPATSGANERGDRRAASSPPERPTRAEPLASPTRPTVEGRGMARFVSLTSWTEQVIAGYVLISPARIVIERVRVKNPDSRLSGL